MYNCTICESHSISAGETGSRMTVFLVVALGLFHCASAFGVSTLSASPLRARASTPTLKGPEYDAAARAAARAARAAAAADGRPPDSTATHDGKLWWNDADAPTRRNDAPATLARSLQAPAAPEQGQAPELDAESVACCLTEFVETDYARRLCDTCNVAPTDYGRLGGMFESVRLRGTTIELKLKRSFEQKSTSLLDRLTKHLRQRMPQCDRLQYMQGTTTRTICL